VAHVSAELPRYERNSFQSRVASSARRYKTFRRQ